MVDLKKVAFEKDKTYIKGGKYKNVFKYQLSSGEFVYLARVKVGLLWSKHFLTEREAALAVDRYLISKGKNPINILKQLLC